MGDRDRLGIGQAAVVATGAADQVGQGAHGGVGHAQGLQPLPERLEAIHRHVGKHQVLLVGDPELAVAELVGQVGDGRHLLRGDVPGGVLATLE